MNMQMQYQNFNSPAHPNSTMNPQQFGYGGHNVGQNGGFMGQNNIMENPQMMNLQMQNMIKTEGMQSQLSNQIAMQQAIHNMNYFGANPALYANQARLNSENNLNTLGGVGGVQPSSNHNINSTSFLEGSGASYKQYLKNNKGSNHQLNDSNNSPNSVPHNHHNINISQFKNKRIIVKHANIVKKKRQIKIWTSEEDELLKKLCEQMPGKWLEIANLIPGRNASQCSQRWRRILPTKVRKPWTPEEDQKVLELSEKYGKNWGMIAQHIEGKTGKQVRERYINKLDPNIKRTPWTEEEDQKILDMFLEQGPKWSAISNELVGRPENTVKNRFYSHISRIYLSDDNSFIGNKNSDNNQKVKDACSKNSKAFTQKKTKQNVRSFNNANNPDAMEEDDYDNEEENDDDDDDEDDDEEDQTQNDQIPNNKNSLNNMHAAPTYLNGAVAAASQQMALEASKKKNLQKNAFGANQINANINNDRKNLKIEEQEDQDEELMEGNPNIEEEDSNKKPNQGYEQHQKHSEEGKDASHRGHGLAIGRLITGGINSLSQNNLDAQSGEKSPQGFSMAGNSMLAKRGKQIKNIEIPKVNTNGGQNGMAVSTNVQNENDNNALTNVISAHHLDLFNTQTPQPYYQTIFTNPSLTPLYNGGFHPNLQQVHLNQPSSAQNETTSPMFVLGNGLNSPAPARNQQLPLFKPPMSGIGNTTPSAITPLVNNQYLVYAPNSLGMHTPGIYPGYNHIITPYYMQHKGFSSITKMGGAGTLNDIDKMEQGDNNAFLNIMAHPSNNYPSFDQTGIQSLTNFNFAPPTPGMAPNSFLNNQQKSFSGNNQQQQQSQQSQQINPSDMIGFSQDGNNNANNNNNSNNKNAGSNVSIQVSQQEQKSDRPSESSILSKAGGLDKLSLESLFKEFSSLDPEKQKLFTQMIQSNSQPSSDNHDKAVKEENIRQSFHQ